MIAVKIFMDSSGRYRGFRVSGHAGCGRAGTDIVCAAVSVLAQNTVNAIESFTEDDISYSVEEGYLDCLFTGGVSKESKLLMDTLVLGFEGIRDSYQADRKKKQIIQIVTEEV
ncbi:MAG: ribosomal-processing cysteine protease Prp [Lachnospiraceae bacterium]|nr:ribosomal-processing cysteine protease Prp [Lachnospiraceae bacterium]